MPGLGPSIHGVETAPACPVARYGPDGGTPGPWMPGSDPGTTSFVVYRPKALFNAGTRSVFSHVNVPNSGSGVRPKWPYALVTA